VHKKEFIQKKSVIPGTAVVERAVSTATLWSQAGSVEEKRNKFLVVCRGGRGGS